MKMLFAFAFLVLPLPVFAQPVLINEIAWMGTPVTGVEEKQWWRYEWIELYNNTDAIVVLDGWTLELYRDKLDFTVSLKGTVVPNGYYVAGASDKIPHVDLNYKNLGGKFNNSGQRIVLKNTVGEIVDEVDARNGWSAGDNKTKQTMERVVGSGPASVWQTSKESGGTPGAPNSEGVKLSLTKDATEKDLMGSSSDSKLSLTKDAQVLQSFQGRVPIVNPITLLAGFLALGFSGVLLVLKRFLASRHERQQLEHPEQSRRT